MEESLLDDEMRSAIGYETQPVVFEIDKTFIRRFVEAVGDTNPLWSNENEANQSGSGQMIAPPSLLCTELMLGQSAWAPIAHRLPKNGVDGGGEWEFFAPIRLGDSISVVGKLANIIERKGRLGTMLIVTSEITWHNQRRELVARATNTAITY